MKRMTTLLGAVSVAALTAGAAQAGEITGRVTEATGSVGLQGAIVRISETGQTVTTSRDGSYRLVNVPAGDFTIVVDYLGADAQTREVSLISADESVETNFVLGADVAVEDNILIIGQRGQLTSALNRQRAADGLISVLSADAVDRLPDENVAEAARRIAGINVLNDQGEGRFVSIRGIDPNLNTTTVNGVRLPSPESDNRQVPLDVIDSDVLSSIVIAKSLTPDMPGDTIGGNIEIETLSGLDQDERLLQFRLRGIYADVVEEYGYRGSLTFADKFLDDRLGVAFSISDQERSFGSENAEADGTWNVDESVPFPEEFENRNYDVTRERTSVVFNLDYDLNESTNLYLRTTYSDFSDQEYRNRIENKFEDPDYSDALSSGNGAFFDASTGDEFEVDRDIKDRLEEQTIYAIAVGGETFAGPWTLDYQLAYAFAEESEPDRIDTGFRAKFDQGIFGVNVTDAQIPQVIFGDSVAEQAYFDGDSYEFDDLELVDGTAQDDEWSAQFNARREMTFGAFTGFVQSGAQYRTREKTYEATTLVYDGFDGPDVLLSQFQTSVEYPLAANFGPALDAGAVRDFFNSNRSSFELNDIDTAVASNADNYGAEEDVFSAYLMGSVDINRLRLVGGVRVEDTQYDAYGFEILEQEIETAVAGDVTGAFESFIAPSLTGAELLASDLDVEYDAGDDETVIEGDRVYRRSVTADNAYTDWLPSLNLRYEASDNLIVRAAYYASIARPNLAQAAPRLAFEENDEGEVEAEAGNPDLERQEAQNFDLAFEFYPTEDAILSAGVFYKSIDNFIAQVVYEDTVINGVALEEATTFINLEDADLTGVELNYQQALTMLPGLLQHTIVGANYTYVDSEATLADGREITLPLQSQNVANLILGYDDGRLDLRAAVSYRDEYIDELGDSAAEDRIILDHTQFDFSAKYDLTENFRLYFDYKNAFDEPFRAVFRDAGRELTSQYEEYSWQAQFGFRYTFGG